MTTEAEQRRYAWIQSGLRESTYRLASSAEEQRAWLTQNGLKVSDELALEFGNFAELSVQLNDELLPAAARRRISTIDKHLDSMSGMEHAELWTPSALTDAPEWGEIRALAADLLALLPPP